MIILLYESTIKCEYMRTMNKRAFFFFCDYEWIRLYMSRSKTFSHLTHGHSKAKLLNST
jgi:hypothetical protein